MTSEITFEECECKEEKIFVVGYTTDESVKFLCRNCFEDSIHRLHVKFAYNTKTKQTIQIHTVTKFLRNNSTDYFCENHNTSYPSLKSFHADHTSFDVREFVVVDKRMVGNAHTEIFAENDN